MGRRRLRTCAAEHGYPTVTLLRCGDLAWPDDKDDAIDWQAYFHLRNWLVVAARHWDGPKAQVIAWSSHLKANPETPCLPGIFDGGNPEQPLTTFSPWPRALFFRSWNRLLCSTASASYPDRGKLPAGQ